MNDTETPQKEENQGASKTVRRRDSGRLVIPRMDVFDYFEIYAERFGHYYVNGDPEMYIIEMFSDVFRCLANADDFQEFQELLVQINKAISEGINQGIDRTTMRRENTRKKAKEHQQAHEDLQHGLNTDPSLAVKTKIAGLDEAIQTAREGARSLCPICNTYVDVKNVINTKTKQIVPPVPEDHPLSSQIWWKSEQEESFTVQCSKCHWPAKQFREKRLDISYEEE